jgi:adenylate cyclase
MGDRAEMSGMTADELAARCGVSFGYLRTLIELGVVSGGAERSFDVPDIQRVWLARELERSGIGLEAIGAAVASGHLSFELVDTVLPAPPVLGSKTLGEAAADLDLPLEAVSRLYAMWGLAPPEREDAIREDDAAVLAELASHPSSSYPHDALVYGARAVGEMAHRVADLAFDLFRSQVEAPMLAAGMSHQRIMDASGALIRPATTALQLEVAWLVRRQIENHTTQLVIEYLQAAIEAAGGPPAEAASFPAIAFLDLAGYTVLTEELGDEAAAERATRLGEIVQEVAHRGGGQVVKLLGDGAMLYFAHSGAAVPAGLELVERLARSGLPPARVGIAAGPVVFRDADCFGRTVNVAARIMERARPGQVLATAEVVHVTDPGVARFDALGEDTLRGLSAPVTLAAASRARSDA